MSDLNNIVFFDGVCTLCNWSVSFLLKADKKRNLKYSSLQSEFAKKNLSDPMSMNSIIFLSQGIEYKRSKAIVKILIALGGFYKVLGFLFSVFPTFILDPLYNLIAKNRYKIFGKKETCRVPSLEESKFFLE